MQTSRDGQKTVSKMWNVSKWFFVQNWVNGSRKNWAKSAMSRKYKDGFFCKRLENKHTGSGLKPLHSVQFNKKPTFEGNPGVS